MVYIEKYRLPDFGPDNGRFSIWLFLLIQSSLTLVKQFAVFG